MLREPRPIAAIDSLNVIGQPIPQPIERIDVDRGFTPIDAGQESLQCLHQLSMQRLMLLQLRIIHVAHHPFFRRVMITRVGKQASQQWSSRTPRFALHDRVMQLVQRVDQNLVLVINRFHANRELFIPVQERHIASCAGAIPVLRTSAVVRKN